MFVTETLKEISTRYDLLRRTGDLVPYARERRQLILSR